MRIDRPCSLAQAAHRRERRCRMPTAVRCTMNQWQGSLSDTPTTSWPLALANASMPCPSTHTADVAARPLFACERAGSCGIPARACDAPQVRTALLSTERLDYSLASRSRSTHKAPRQAVRNIRPSAVAHRAATFERSLSLRAPASSLRGAARHRAVQQARPHPPRPGPPRLVGTPGSTTAGRHA